MKAKISSEFAFVMAQPFVGEFLNSPTTVADHKTMATFYGTQATLHKSTAGYHLVSQIEAAEEVQYPIYADVIQVFALLS